MKRAVALRVSLLVSMGLLPLACSAERLEATEEGGGGAGGSNGKPVNPDGAGSGSLVSTAACTSPKVDATSGLIACAEGYSHRPTAAACSPVNAPSAGGAGPADEPNEAQAGFGGMGAELDCNRAPSLCDAIPHGFCAVDDLGPDTSYDCESGCVTDEDCGLNRICVCGHPESPTGGRCAVSNCVTDADCGTGLLCASYEEGCGPGGFACLRDDDVCRSDADCEFDQCGIANDIFRPTEARRECGLSVCGRPFLIELQARVAPLREGDQWGVASLVPRLDHLSEAERAEQAAHWARLGQMEHASIAAFARFSLQLLALGAPPDLVAACTQALADETRHTRLCFQLASAYAGYGIAPGALDIARSLEAASLVDIVDLVIAEGCVGETNAALEALAAADTATDGVVANVYAQIAEDEQRHAALAFRFLHWALQQADAEVRPRIHAALLALPATPTGREVVGPCLRALLEQPAPQPERMASLGLT
jgi:hypothetical protein